MPAWRQPAQDRDSHRPSRHDRFLIQLTVGPMPHDRVLRAIELLGTEVAPVVRKETGG